MLAGEVDPALGVATDRSDVIIGEVKRGVATSNPALRDPRFLHGVFRRVGDVFGAPYDEVVDELARTGLVWSWHGRRSGRLPSGMAGRLPEERRCPIHTC